MNTKLILLWAAAYTATALAQSPGTFSTTGSMITARYGHTATLLNDGRVLITGGVPPYTVDGPRVENSAEIYDPATGTFTATAPMITPRGGYTATLHPDGKVLIAGGSALPSAELYDPSTGTFIATGDMIESRGAHRATLLSNGKVLLAGGLRRDPFRLLASAELYDPSTGTFSSTGEMSEACADSATLLPNGLVLITRGFCLDPPDNGDGNEIFVRQAELYDPLTGVFVRTGDLTDSRGRPTATLLMNGKVLIPGGGIGDGDGEFDSAELYDPATRRFAATGKMTSGRLDNTATLLSDGTVLIAGGHLATELEASVELYDPVKGTFRATGNMAAGREYHTATLLKDGRVLIAGGVQFWLGHTVLASAELYNPPVLVPAPVLLSVSGDGRGQGAILHASTHQLVSPGNPAIPGEVLELYLTGLTEGSLIPPQVSIGGRMAEILYFGKAPGYEGLNQVNVRVPSSVAAASAVPVRLSYIGRSSNEVTIGVR